MSKGTVIFVVLHATLRRPSVDWLKVDLDFNSVLRISVRAKL